MTQTRIFAKQLRKARKNAGLSQTQLGAMAGVARTAICRYEAGRMAPDLNNFVIIADALGVNADVLLGRRQHTSRTGKEENYGE